MQVPEGGDSLANITHHSPYGRFASSIGSLTWTYAILDLLNTCKLLIIFLNDSGGKSGDTTCPSYDGHILFECLCIELAHILHKLATIRQIDIVDSRVDAIFYNFVVCCLKGPTGVYNHFGLCLT